MAPSSILRPSSLALVAALLLAGCVNGAVDGDDTLSPHAGVSPGLPHELRVETFDYGFRAPSTTPAGWTEVVAQTRGADLHHVGLFRLPAGKTAAAVREHYEKDGAEMPDWLEGVGGPNVLVPGEATRALVELTPGEYVLVCVIPDSHGTIHAKKGMVHALTVTAATGNTAAPVADVTLRMDDFAFSVVGELRAGPQTIRFENAASHVHEAVFFELYGDASTMEFLEWVGTREGEPKGGPAGGITPMEGGRVAFARTDFAPGRYTIVCFEGDGLDGKPHFLEGMFHEFTIAG